MYRNENLRKIIKVFIVAFLCSELESNLSQRDAFVKRSATYLSDSDALPANAKHQASVRIAALDGIFGEGHICSGALVAPSVVLTAAQCLHDYDQGRARHPAEVRVVLGTPNRYQRDEDTLSYGVTHIFRPPTFDPRTLNDNIAILMLERDVPLAHAAVQPIAWRPLEATARRRPIASHEVTSWMHTAEGIPLAELMAFNVTKAPQGSCCDKGYICMRSSPVAASHREMCARDLGAPLMRHNQLLGVAAGRAGGGGGAGGDGGDCTALTFTDVARHSKWIASQIGDGTNLNSAIWGNLGFMLFTLFTLKTSRLVKF